jgi:CelD/BcsL family acetyltransferase involved in cellulose biosynthesis
MTTFTVVPATALSADHKAIWEKLQRSNPDLESPYFCPKFTELVGEVRDRVYVTLIEEGGEIKGVFPFQKNALGQGRPVGGPLSDYHGIIAAPETAVEAKQLVKRSGLRAWEYDHLIGHERMGDTGLSATSRSPVIRVHNGYEHYLAELQKSGSSQIRKIENLRRRIEREVGPLRFTFQSRERPEFEAVLSWKSAQCKATGSSDTFSFTWARELVEKIFLEEDPSFQGVLSTLHAGEQLVAAHFGMRAGAVLHWWFPVYDHTFSKYSPGISLLFSVAEFAQDEGVKLIDMGKGEQLYKTRLMNDAIPITEGAVVASKLTSTLRRTAHSLQRQADKENRNPVIALPGRALNRLDRWARWR